MALGSSGIAGYARIAFESTGVEDVTRDSARVERAYTSATKDMSDGALKLELAEDRLQKALKRGPSNYAAIARAELGVRRARADLRGETDRLERSEDRRSRGLGKLRGNLVAYAGAYLGAAGVLSVVRSSLAAAREEELVMGQTSIAVEAAGLSWERYARRIETVIKAQSALGFDDEELLKTFATFVRRTRDVDEALRLNALSADLARARYMDLESASKLVLKASMGSAGALRRVGIDAEQGASGVELITKLTEQYGRSAEDASNRGTASSDRFHVAIENLEEAVGRGLNPTVTEYTNRLTKWLDTAENQEELQRRVNEAVETATEIMHGFARGVEGVSRVVRPLIGHVGGLENAVTALLIGGIVYKSAKAVAAVRGLALTFGLVGPAATAAAVQATAAEAAIGTGATVAASKVMLIRTALLRTLATYVAVQAAVDALTPGGQGLDFSDPTSVSTTPTYQPGIGWVNADGKRIPNQRYWDKLVAGGYYDPSSSKREAPSKRERREARERLRGQSADSSPDLAPMPSVAAPSTPPSSRYLPTTSPAVVAAAVESGAERGTQRGIERAAERQRRLDEFYGKRTSREVPTVRPRRESGGDTVVKGVGTRKGPGAGLTIEEVDRRQLEFLEDFGSPLTPSRASLRRRWARLRDERYSVEQVLSAQFDFLRELRSTLDQFGSNIILDEGQLGTHAAVQTELQRALVGEVRNLAAGARQPASRYGYRVLTSAMDGYSF
jgi:hypothetical protein